MKKILYLFVLAIPFVCAGCEDDRENSDSAVERMDDGAFYSVSFIQSYVIADSFEIMHPTGDDQVVYALSSGQQKSGQQYYDVFNDNTFKRRVVPFTNKAIFNTFVKMDIVSDSDFDEQHKAGATLSDIVRFVGMSASDYIGSGCTETYDWKTVPAIFDAVGWEDHKFGYSPVEMLLSEVGEDDLKLISPMFYLNFEKQPTLSRMHNLTLTVTDNKGKTLTVTWEQQFGE